ncbi:MAG: SPFH domain-containing protein [Turicibacter sp.]|nr:SPFH domain-containing protein [Turicibacter sp.]
MEWIFYAVGAVLVLAFLVAGYVKAPPDEAFIISGIKKEPRVLVGRAGFRIPFLERLDKLYLKQVTVDVKTGGFIPTLDFINIRVDAVAKVKICDDPESLKLAMRNFLNKQPETIIDDLQDSLQGNMREIIGTLSLKDVSQNRDEFGNQVHTKAQSDMRRLGIEIITCNVQSVEDESGLIKDMGMDNTYKIKKDAAIAKAESNRDVAILQAAADKQANDARIQAGLEIAEKNNELEIRQAELKKIADTKKAEAEAAFEIQRQEQRKTIETTSTNADIAKREREIELKQREAAVMEQSLVAEIKKKAEAEKYRQEQEADAKLYIRTKEAEAKKVEMQREAEALRIQAEAERYSREQAAEAVKAQGLAEAQAIQAKGLAEAEAIDKKAEAMKKYGQAAILEMIVGVLPEMAKNVAEPIAAIDKVTVIGGDSKGIADMSANVPMVMAKVMESVKEATGIDMHEIVKADSMEAKTNRNITLSGLENLQITPKKNEDK